MKVKGKDEGVRLREGKENEWMMGCSCVKVRGRRGKERENDCVRLNASYERKLREFGNVRLKEGGGRR